MPSSLRLEGTQEAGFAHALLNPEAPLPAALSAGNEERARRRFAIHRNTVMGGLVAALGQRYPAARMLLGGAFFDAMAAEFARSHPPRSPLLFAYGAEFADFAGSFTPAASLPYLADVMRLENARLRAWHAPEVAPLGLEALLGLLAAPEAVHFRLHPAAGLLASPHPAVTIWAMQAGERPLAPLVRWEPEEALVGRRGDSVLVQRLPPGGCAFAWALGEGATLADATEAALARDPGFALSDTLALLVRLGTLCLPASFLPPTRAEQPR
ncbi:DNA-binding domain-containing protein [Roseomonas sp. GC11]|uniref:HvfC/BufC N-terminal domain-containing protein n=1 Tax=Roseomonas sp. GC11 TaxID=2950546 RepID=UPI0021087328|nr:DNA-binding domain-containing protein [Roseomonas sp. GC11]MCQ4160981.1 DNA-binding domain-containing protein [Roseomonas sp. GC11]